MVRQMAFAGEGFRAEVALERPAAQVGGHVAEHVAFLREALAAMVAFKGLVSRVAADMF